MGGNNAINNLTTAYNGTYWQGANISSKDLASNLVYTGGIDCVKSNWDYGVTLNEDAVKDIVEKITKKRELAKITPDEGPEIPKWTGFIKI
jgi:hypothetical protein